VKTKGVLFGKNQNKLYQTTSAAFIKLMTVEDKMSTFGGLGLRLGLVLLFQAPPPPSLPPSIA
jgi:hypothetical protein